LLYPVASSMGKTVHSKDRSMQWVYGVVQQANHLFIADFLHRPIEPEKSPLLPLRAA
jgi:hypothetical protein